MRLGPKIFVASSLVMLVLLGVGALSLRAVGRLVSVNQAITTQTVPAVRRAAAAHDAVLSLARLEARFLVLGDPAFAALWNEHANRAGEELDRLASHVAQIERLIAGGGAIGRRLDFLAQELNREANTLCSKSNDVELTNIGLELKSVVEQFREQVQNLE